MQTMQFHNFGCFMTHPKQWAILEKKTEEFDIVFSLQKIEKGWFYKTRGSLAVILAKDGLFYKILVLSLMGFCTGMLSC